MSSLTELHIYGSSLTGPVPSILGRWNLYKLQNLDLSFNDLSGDITEIIEALSCSNQSLEIIYLSYNQLTGKVPPFLGQFDNLKSLDLSRNTVNSQKGISGSIPTSIGNLSNLEYLNLDNMMKGSIPESIGKLTNLESLDLLQNYWEVDFSFNQLKGSVPLWFGVRALHLRNNLLSGTVPTNIGEEMSHLRYLDLSNNYLNGRIPMSLNRIQNLSFLDISNNDLTGDIPKFWMGMQSLQIIDLSNNSLSGRIPTSICSLTLLVILELGNNDLSADLSSVFQNCTRLRTLSLENNRFYGSIPYAINKNIPSLSELLLRGNNLTGSIPKELCHLPSLHLLDLADNNISGSIPACLGDVHGFKLPQTDLIYLMFSFTASGYVPYIRHIELVLKGKTTEYTKQMLVYSIIDFSKNHISGEIPEKITQLIHLGALNLSWNQLNGSIPNNIGSLTDLESLDLSHNHFSGAIPPSMASMTFLSYLNLSYNNLSGQIPVANQFGTFNEPSIYVGNPGLCGHPLPTNCTSLIPGNGEQDRKHEDEVDGDDDNERLGLYASIAVGYITGFWIVCGSLVLKRSWRHAYFNFVYDTREKLLILMAVNLARLKRNLDRKRTEELCS
ncbi:LRR receptor-like kinase resistance protein [Trifolium pratense]|uniref:LRR receptor-like kinase resistance protein n=1 Tax=Trifolium pratense TaxID=57577 RepID=A0A2K3P5N9_TRIPR|nr:LRR receptor-like kinase resistance protein [Trifolium pratense]